MGVPVRKEGNTGISKAPPDDCPKCYYVPCRLNQGEGIGYMFVACSPKHADNEVRRRGWGKLSNGKTIGNPHR